MTFVAFLRAINVGGHTVKMTVLAGLFDELGFENVETFIASGNVFFESRTRSAAVLERTIAEHLGKRLGYDVETFIRTPSELRAIANYRAFAPAELSHPRTNLFIAFFHEKPKVAAVNALTAAATSVDRFHLNGRDLYWLIHGGFSDSQFSGAKLEKLLGAPATVRNIKTVRRITDKYAKDL